MPVDGLLLLRVPCSLGGLCFSFLLFDRRRPAEMMRRIAPPVGGVFAWTARITDDLHSVTDALSNRNAAADRPVIGITTDIEDDRLTVRPHYARIVHEEGGLPMILSPIAALAEAYASRCDGFILTGGDDPIMEHWGVATHPQAKKIHLDRQAFELALLDALDRSSRPALGVCLGMQLMGLRAGGTLDQFLPETLASAGDHWGRKPHAVRGELGEGVVLSHHRQALTDAGRLRVVAAAPDGVIEAIDDPARRFYLGVQWHPERTEDETLGRGIIQRLIEAALETR